ncbi:restriction endonuclease subunit S [Lactobacillus amylovorus]|nr:restriction endonuclease subunit S [Lactobacillus amylovorus]MDB6241720.1 restriction endonuclease subunit S [Lactobacillus amylovorus]
MALLLFTFFVWEQRKLIEILKSPVTDGPHETPQILKKGVPFISVEAIVNNKIDFNRKRGYISFSYNAQCNKKYRPQKKDVLLVKSGSTVGKVAVVETNTIFNIWSPLAALRVTNSNDPYFLYYLLQTNTLQRQIINKSKGGTQPNLSMRILEQFKIFLPQNYLNQQKIEQLLRTLDKCISLQQRKVKMLVLLKKEISNYYFSPSYLSRSCKENSFKEIFTVVTDYVANGSFKSLRENVKTNTKQGYAYMIRLQDASNNWKGPWLYTDKSGYNFLKKSKIYPGDIVMSNVGSVGKIIRIPKLSKPMTLAPNAILLRSTKYDNDFLYELLKSDYGKNKIKRMTTPGVQNKINKTDFKKIKVHLPNSQEQKRISCLLTNMNILIHEVKSNISQKQKLKQFLLQNMFI